MNNQRGGIISNLILIPAALALMAGFFFLGYYVGRYQAGKNAAVASAPPLPEVVSRNLPRPEEYTFFKTLTEKEDKTISIELRPRPAAQDGEKQSVPHRDGAAGEKPRDRGESPEKLTARTEPGKPNPAKQAPAQERKAAAPKLRYTLQLSSHQERQAAEDDVRRMKQNGFAAFVVASELPGKGTWYRVRLGSFSSKDAAEKLMKEVHAKAGVSPIVVLE